MLAIRRITQSATRLMERVNVLQQLVAATCETHLSRMANLSD
jgi:hypothetical protein